MRKHVVAALLLVLACGLVWAATASATVYSGANTYSAPVGTPSLNGPPSDPAQSAPYLQMLSGSYNDQSGTVTIQFRLYDPATWGPAAFGQLGREYNSNSGVPFDFPVSFQLGFLGDAQHPATLAGDPTPTVFCNTHGWPGINQPSLAGPVLGVSITRTLNSDGSFAALTANAQLQGYSGAVTAPVSFDGTTYTVTAQNSAFQGHVWDCLVANNTIELPITPPAPPPSPTACKTYERDILRYAPNHIQSWHNMTCQGAKQVLRRSRIVKNGNLHVPGFRCRVRHRYRAGKTITGANVYCTAPGKWFLLKWAT